jgi:hypothetical protein
MTTCIGCRAQIAETDGPTHRYLGASPGCWARFGEVRVRQQAWPGFAHHQPTVDAYCVQHPGEPNAQTIQSVIVHLLSLHLMLERGATAAQSIATMRRLTEAGLPLEWLPPPPSLGTLTIADVAAATDRVAHEAVVARWARDAFAAWAPHHATVRRWLAALG